MTYEEAVRYLLTLGRELASQHSARRLFVIPSAARNLTVAGLDVAEMSHLAESRLGTSSTSSIAL